MTEHDTAPATPATGASGTTLVTGATGNTGGRVVGRLVSLGRPVTAASRGATAPAGARGARFDWYDPATHDEALRGADRVYVVPPVGDPDPAPVVLPFLRRARAAGVRRVVLLSSSAIRAGDPGVGQVHAALDDLFETWSVLRPSWFMQNFTGQHPHADSVRGDGVLTTATGTGRVGFVDAEDIAEVAVHALTDDPPPTGDLVITGPEALSYDEVAALLSAVTGRPVSHAPVGFADLRDRLAAGLPMEYAAFLAGLDRAIAEGAEEYVTDTVLRLTGRPPHTLREHAVAHLGQRPAPATRPDRTP
ncbi:NAD(P)H-binding protein [Streptomyces sp. 71268]|uniref:NmrA family NAD(P)-binding protein n=1 Tax=Streptomyces sp. 71268 TaxID=3002640 RepID=UPI0023F7A93F|nr:NAD(P)H-binding protein [Streptomyces sp. 71268]WEV27990.1 NAD(P)H-binding protein [Streptomyces sp. 71268]